MKSWLTSSIIFVVTILGLFIVGVGLVGADGQIQPFSFGNSYNLSLVENVEGGGKVNVEFMKDKPEVRLKKWNGEVDMGVSSAIENAKAQKSLFGNKVEWKNAKDSNGEEMHAYPTKDGKFEIEIKLNQKSATNKFDFNIDGAEDLDFFYQPALNQEIKIGERGVVACTETECKNKDGHIVTSRPENVVGSYAVYSKTKKDYIVGQTNYGTGKVYHIYRPKAVDALGKEQWAVLNYKDGVLSVTVPQDFLDTATYPVLVDPTFGYTTVRATQVETGQDTLYAVKYTLFETGIIQSMSAYGGQCCDSIHHIAMAIYTSPSTNVYKTNTSGVLAPAYASPGWATANTVTNPTLAAGDYLLYVNSDWDYYWNADTGGTGKYDSNLTYGSAWPATLTNPFNPTTWKWSIYATYAAPHVGIRGGGSATNSNVKVRGGGANYQTTAYVQSTSKSDMFNSVNTLVQAFQTQNVTTGNLIAGFTFWSSATDAISSITDSCSNTYTVVSSTLMTSGTYSIEGFYAKNVAGGSKCSVTITYANAETNKGVILYEISGADTSSPLDGQVATNVGSVGGGTNAASSGNWTTSTNGDFLVGAMMSRDFSGTTITAGTTSQTYTLGEFQNGNNQEFASEHAVQTTASASTVTAFTTSAFTGSIILSGMAFKHAILSISNVKFR